MSMLVNCTYYTFAYCCSSNFLHGISIVIDVSCPVLTGNENSKITQEDMFDVFKLFNFYISRKNHGILLNENHKIFTLAVFIRV